MFYWLSYTKHMIINKVTMNIMINLIQMLLIFVFEIRPRDCLQNDSGAMTVFTIISLFPRDQRSELFNGGPNGGPKGWGPITQSRLIFGKITLHVSPLSACIDYRSLSGTSWCQSYMWKTLL